jgi:hypothetical protein
MPLRIGGFFVKQRAQRHPFFALGANTLDERLEEVSKMLELPVNSTAVFRYMILMVDRDHNVETANYKADLTTSIFASAVTFAISAL